MLGFLVLRTQRFAESEKGTGTYIAVYVPVPFFSPNIFDGHTAPQGFTGVFDSATGKILMQPSRTGSDLPAGWVARRGGHRSVSQTLGGDAANHRGFAVILQEDGTLRVTWGSGTLNSPPDYLVPLNVRQLIVDAIEAATGINVGSF